MAKVDTYGVLALLGVALGYSIFGVSARYLYDGFGAYHQLWIRALVAGLIALCLSSHSGFFQTLRSLPSREWGLIFVRAACLYPLGAVPWIVALQETQLGVLSFISALPLEAAWALIIYRIPVTRAAACWILLSILGLSLICDPRTILGARAELLALISTLFFSLGIVLRRSHCSSLSNMQLTALLCVLGAAQTALVAFLVGEPLPRSTAVSEWGAIVGLGGLITCSMFLSNRGFERVSAALAGTILMLDCVFSPLLGYLLFDEVPTSMVVLGGLLIIASALGLLHQESRHTRCPTSPA